MSAMIELSNTTKLYGSVIGVNDFTFTLAPGAYGILGPNGSGKTTFLNLVTGQLRPTLGAIRVFDHNPWNNHELLRRIGVCPAQDVLYPNVSGREWVRYLLRLQGFDPREASRRADEALVRVGMAESMGRAMGGYSKGMRQRTKLAQAVAHDPDLLVLDEPFNGLDPIGRHEMTEFLRKWIGSRSLLLASHILHEVGEICASFLLILGGRLLASGTADEMHVLLSGIPCEVAVRCNQPQQLAQRAIADDVAEAVRLEPDRVIVSTRDVGQFAARLPVWSQEGNLWISEVQAPEDTLQSLFNALIRLHRGEPV